MVSQKSIIVTIIISWMLLTIPPFLRECQAEEPVRNVLFLFAFEHNVPSYHKVERGVKQVLDGDLTVKNVYYYEHMDLARFPEKSYHESLADRYRQKYNHKKIDLIIALNSPALDFIIKHGEQVFPGVPVLFSLILRGQAEKRNLPNNITGVADSPDFTGTLDLGLKLLPRTQKVFVISGSDEADKGFELQLKLAYEPYKSKLEFTYLSGLPMNVLLREVASLPKKSLIIYSSIYKDGLGQAFVPIIALRQIAAVASAPIFGAWDPFLGNGVVGGSVADLEQDGLDVGQLALDVLKSGTDSPLPKMRYGKNVIMLDWRQMKRWGFSSDSLPPGSVIKFKDLGFWDLYKWEAFGFIAMLLLETLLIGLLLIHRARRLRAEFALQVANEDLEKRVSTRTSEIESVNQRLLSEMKERLQAEENTRQSLDLLQSTLDALSSHIAILDESGSIIAVNAAWRLFGDKNGLSIADYGVGLNYLVICDTAEGECAAEGLLVADAIRELLCGARNSLYLEYPCHAPSQKRWFALRITQFIILGKQRLVLSHEDITHRKMAEDGLRQSEEKFRLAFKTSPDAININRLDDGLYVEVNEGFTQLTGFTSKEVIGTTSLEINIWDDPADRKTLVARLCENGYYENFEARFRKKDGGMITALMSARLISLDGLPHIISITRDISDRIKAQADKDRLEAQLRHAHKMEAIGTLSGGIAHDFNNILGAVIGYAEIALDDLIAGGRVNSSDIQQILYAADRAKRLVKQILTYSRKVEYNLRPININCPIQDILPMIERTLPKMVSIENRLANNLFAINADPNQIEQIIMNLASNASDAMSDGGRLLIETTNIVLDDEFCRDRQEVIPGTYILLSVSDTGQGMTEKVMDCIFDPFFTTKDIGKGTGLGLSTVYGIVKAHAGYVYCDSEPGVGTTFKIFFPAIQNTSTEVPLDALTQDKLLGGTETILLVDDEEPLRQLGSKTLVGMNYKVMTAKSGEEALKIFRDNKAEIDLVVMDLGMPGMGGHKATKAILEINPRAKVIIASGYSAFGRAKGALDGGALGYVGKPYKREELLATVRSVLDSQ